MFLQNSDPTATDAGGVIGSVERTAAGLYYTFNPPAGYYFDPNTGTLQLISPGVRLPTNAAALVALLVIAFLAFKLL